MLLGLLSIITLILLGLINAKGFVAAKHAQTGEFITKLLPFEAYIGLAGVVFGVFGILSFIGNLDIIGYALASMLLGLASSLLILALGLISFAPMLKGQIISGNAALCGKVDNCVAKLAPHQTNLGLAGIVIGVLYFVMLLVR